MTVRVPTPRWLPATIGVLAGLLAVKSVTLVRAVIAPGTVGDVSFLSSNAVASAAPSTPAEPKKSQPAPPPPLPAAEQPPAEPPMTASEKAVLLELRQRRQDLDARAGALGERESLLAAAEQKLAARVDELQALQQRLEAMGAERRKQEDASWQGLVKLYETMKPRDAATIFNDLAMPVLVQVMDRMKDAKAAAVLAAMDPDKARLLTQEIARLRTRITTEPRPAPKPAPPKG